MIKPPNLKFVHYSYDPDIILQPKDYLELGIGKPLGLWFSIEGIPEDLNWRDWCIGEEFRIDHLKFRYNIEFKPEANLIILDTRSAMEAFTLLYGKNLAGFKVMQEIQWERVAEDYDGIIIAPYQWECRFDLFWYYCWDCASGCVWNIDSIESFERINE